MAKKIKKIKKILDSKAKSKATKKIKSAAVKAAAITTAGALQTAKAKAVTAAKVGVLTSAKGKAAVVAVAGAKAKTGILATLGLKAKVAGVALTGLLTSSVILFNNDSNGFVNLVATEPGIYRISYEELKSKGVDLNGFQPSEIALSHLGEPVPRFIFDGDGDGFNQGDYVEFIGAQVNNRYTDETVYTFHIDPEKAEDIPSFIGSNAQNYAISAEASVQVAKKKYFWITSPDLEDPFYMDSLYTTSGPVSKSYELDLPDLDLSAQTVKLVVDVYGGSDLFEKVDHEVHLSINDVPVAQKLFSGKNKESIVAEVPIYNVKPTNNSIEITLPFTLGTPLELVAISSVKIEYQKLLTVSDEQTPLFTSAESLQFSGTTEDTVVYEVDGENVFRTTGSADSFVVEAKAAGSNNVFFVADGNFNAPIIRQLPEFTDIRSGSAEYLVISHPDFINQDLQRLVNLRQGAFSTKIVDVQQIYAQFGRYAAEAQPIKNYIKYAAKNLNTKMVLLVGGDSHDYHQYLGDSVSHIPTLYASIGSDNTRINHAPSDAAYGDIDDDDVPDIAIGRLPVRVASELESVVNKIMQFEQRTYRGEAVFAADEVDAGKDHSFTPSAEEIITHLPEGIKDSIVKAYVEELGEAKAKSTLIESINQGAELTAYFGHSTMYQWSSGNLFNTVDVEALNNFSKPTVITQYGCWNTLFTLPESNSMAHVAMLSGENGAVAVLGASTLTLASSEEQLGKVLIEKMYLPNKTIGEALIEAKKAIVADSGNSVSDVVLGWQVMGDPAIVMNPE